MSNTYQCWRDYSGLTFSTKEEIQKQMARGLLKENARMLYSFEADSWNEAMTEHYRRQGWDDYVPMKDTEDFE